MNSDHSLWQQTYTKPLSKEWYWRELLTSHLKLFALPEDIKKKCTFTHCFCMTICIPISLCSEWGTRRCHVRWALPRYRDINWELLLTAPLLIHWCVYESYCSFFFFQSSKASLLVAKCVSRHVSVSSGVCVYMVVHVSVCVHWFPGISWGQNNTSTKIQTQQPCRTQRKIIAYHRRYFSMCWGLGENMSVCLRAFVSICMSVHACSCGYM